MLRDCFEPTGTTAIDKLLFYISCCLDCATPILEALFITSLADATSYETIETVHAAMRRHMEDIEQNSGLPQDIFMSKVKSKITLANSWRKLELHCFGPLLYSLGSVTYERVKYGEIERLIESFLFQLQ